MKQVPDQKMQQLASSAEELAAISLDMEARKKEANDAIAKLNESIVQYNNVVHNIRGVVEGITKEMDEYMAEKPGDWDETEEGEQYAEWYSAWEDLDITDIESVNEIELDTDDTSLQDALNDLPQNPE